jgi:hypothetical protein
MSAWVFGSIAIEITGSGNSIDSSTIGWRGSQSVSPVDTVFRPTTATMSPAKASGISWRLLACIWSSRPTRSLRSSAHVQHLLARLHAARVHAQVAQVPDVLVAHQLEDERENGSLSSALRVRGSPASGVGALHRRHVERRRQVVHHGVQQRLDALVLERRAAQHGHHGEPERRLAQRLAELVGRDRLALEVAGRQRVVEVGGRLDQPIARRLHGGRRSARAPAADRSWAPRLSSSQRSPAR